jgi:four helix bundle protein
MDTKIDNRALRDESRLFAIKIVQLYKHISNDKKELILSEQLLSSGTGIGANIARAGYSLNTNEYAIKLYNALQDGAATRYWLELLNQSGLLTEYEFNSTMQDLEALQKTLALTIKTFRASQA